MSKFLDHLKICNDKNINYLDFRGNTYWHCLAYSGNYEALKLAIKEKKFNKYLCNNRKSTIWHYLASSGNYEVIKLAIKEKQFDKSIFNYHGDTIWKRLARLGNCKILKLGIEEKQFNKSIRNHRGLTLWHFLARSDNYKDFKSNLLNTLNNSKIYMSLIELYIEKNNIDLDKLIIPEKYLCPISRNLMKDPVITEAGINYDKEYIEEWFEKNNNDPYTNIPVSSKKTYENIEKRNEIIEFLKSV